MLLRAQIAREGIQTIRLGRKYQPFERSLDCFASPHFLLSAEPLSWRRFGLDKLAFERIRQSGSWRLDRCQPNSGHLFCPAVNLTFIFVRGAQFLLQFARLHLEDLRTLWRSIVGGGKAGERQAQTDR